MEDFYYLWLLINMTLKMQKQLITKMLSGNQVDYKIKFLKNVTEKDLLVLPVKIESRVNKAIQERLTVDPINLGELYTIALKGLED